jgi:hypothetical protein
MEQLPPVGQGLLMIEAAKSHSDKPHKSLSIKWNILFIVAM